jgi:hypothetical protein
VLRVNFKWGRFFSVAALLSAGTRAAEAPIAPLSVCEVLHDLAAHEGKNVAVLGRYSFRTNGRWIGEQACTPAVDTPPQLWLVENTIEAPKPPDDFEIDGVTLRRKFTELAKHTTLGKFRFGTPDYDRWAVIYGRLEVRKGEDPRKASASLVIRGNGVIVFVTPD